MFFIEKTTLVLSHIDCAYKNLKVLKIAMAGTDDEIELKIIIECNLIILHGI